MTTSTATLADCLEWLAANPGRGYGACGKALGLPKATVAAWVRAAKGGDPIKPRPRARAQAREPEPEPSDFDPTQCSDVEFLEDRLRHVYAQARTTTDPAVARQWERTLLDIRSRLDEVRQERKRLDEAAGRDSLVDPADIARRVLRQVPALVRLCPDECRELARQIAERLEGQ